MTTDRFHMPCQLEAIDPLILSLKDAVESKMTPEMLIRLDICLSEALANLVLHAQDVETDASIEVALLMHGAALVVEIFDPQGAKPFDMRDHVQALRDIDVMAESGRGIGLILECADHVEYSAKMGRMSLVLTFSARE